MLLHRGLQHLRRKTEKPFANPPHQRHRPFHQPRDLGQQARIGDHFHPGGGELGGWLWRYWWHFTELEAIAASDLSFTDRVLTFLSLGRYPETGNILDVLFVSFPLSLFWELPAHYNLKVFFILVVDGLCGYALGRSLSRQPVTALAAGLLAVVNPLNLQDIHGSGLRQVVLWWVLLFPIALARAEERQRPIDGALAGLVLALVVALGVLLAEMLTGHAFVPPGNKMPWRELAVARPPEVRATVARVKTQRAPSANSRRVMRTGASAPAPLATSTLALALAMEGKALVRSPEQWEASYYADGGAPEALAYKITLWEAFDRAQGWRVEQARIPGLVYPTWAEFEASWADDEDEPGAEAT